MARDLLCDHRFRQHRHRPDDQDHAHLEASGDGGAGRHRSGSPTAWRAPRGWASPTTHEGIEGLREPAGVAGDRHRVRRHHRAGAHMQNNEICQRRGQGDDRPDAGGDRSLCHSGGQWRRASGRAERQHGDLRRPGDHSRSWRRSAQVAKVHYAEIVASIASQVRRARARAPTSTSSPRPPRAASKRWAAPRKGKAIIVLNPGRAAGDHARHGLYPVVAAPTRRQIEAVDRGDGRRGAGLCAGLSPEAEGAVRALRLQQSGRAFPASAASKASRPRVFLEVEGAAHYLPAYAGNLDIMTSAALRTAEKIAARKLLKQAA